MTTNPRPRALVTGASSGIGTAFAERLAKEGYDLIIVARRRDKLEELAGRLKEDHKVDVEVLTADLSKSALLRTVEKRIAEDSALELLVNNAGFGILRPTSEIDAAEMRRQYETNVFGLMNVTRAFLPKMRERRSGRIVNVSSLGGRITLPYFGVYNSTKYALESLSEFVGTNPGPVLAGCLDELSSVLVNLARQPRRDDDPARLQAARGRGLAEAIERSQRIVELFPHVEQSVMLFIADGLAMLDQHDAARDAYVRFLSLASGDRDAMERAADSFARVTRNRDDGVLWDDCPR